MTRATQSAFLVRGATTKYHSTYILELSSESQLAWHIEARRNPTYILNLVASVAKTRH